MLLCVIIMVKNEGQSHKCTFENYLRAGIRASLANYSYPIIKYFPSLTIAIFLITVAINHQNP